MAKRNKKPNTPSAINNTILSEKITVRASPRITQEVQNWKNALQSAESLIPRRTLLYDLYDDVLLDGRLESVTNKRILAITNADWQFVKDGKVIEGLNDLIDTPAFEYLLREIMLAKFWGYSMIECDFTGQNFAFYNIPRKHIRPLKGMVAYQQNGDGDLNVREGMYLNTVLEVGEARDLGLLLKAAPYVIYKRGGFGDWAQFVELFGRPFLKGTYNGFDLRQKQEIEQTLSNAGKINAAVVPDGASLDIVSASGASSNSDSFDTFRKACNEEITTLILGQTMTTDNGASKSQSETHKEVEEDINKADRLFVRRVLNTRFLEMLVAAGFDTQGGYFNIAGENEEHISLLDKMQILIQTKNELGLPIDPNQVYDEFGVSKPADFDQQMQDKTAATLETQEKEALKHSDPADKNAPTPPSFGRKKTQKTQQFGRR